MKFKFAMLAAAAALMTSGAANAQINAFFDEGNGSLQAGETSFATFNAGDNGGVTGSYVIQSNSDADGAEPAFGDQGDNYLSVLAGQSASFDFTTAYVGGISQLGLDFGSADWYNTFELLLSDGSSVFYTGQDVINIPPGNGDQNAPRTNGRLTFVADAGYSILGLNLSSSQNSLETDNYGVIPAIPEPSTWAMMLLGFGAIGFGMRRKRSARLLQVA